MSKISPLLELKFLFSLWFIVGIAEVKQTSHDPPTLKNRTTLVGVNYWYENLFFCVLPNSTNSLDASVPYSYQWDVERWYFCALCITDDNFFLEFYSTLRLYWFQSSCLCVHLVQTNIFTSAFRHPLLAENHTTFCCLLQSLPVSLPSEEAKQAYPNALQVKPAWLAHIHVHHQVKWLWLP